MANKTHPTASGLKSKTVDNRKGLSTRSPEMRVRLVALGVPPAFAADFPLTPHPTGRWCKKIKGKVYFFGKLTDGWQPALERYKAECDDLFAGRKPAARQRDGLTLLDLCNRFLHYKRGKVNTGELTMRSWYDYHQTGERLLKVFGKNRQVSDIGPADFETLRADYAKTWGAVRIGNEVNRARIIFRYAFEQDCIERPVKFGQAFQRADRKTLRKLKAKQRAQHGPRMFTADELRKIIDAAPQPLKSMVLLGINGGLNNMDVATLYMGALDIDRGWLDFPRGKTGVPRRIPMWPETVASIKAYLAVRPEPKNLEDAQLVFLTRQRRPWYRLGRFVEVNGAATVKGIDNPVSKQFRAFLEKLGLNGRRNFLALRHGFRTIGRGAKDREAIDALMGHVDETMASHYIEDGLPDERLQTVVEHVRAWLFGSAK